MSLFRKKQEVNLEDFCRDFYEKYILNPMIGSIDAGTAASDSAKNLVAEVDQNFANVDSKTFAAEVVILRFELFALAWLHEFGDRLAVVQSDFTKDYLHEKKREDIWDDMESYNQAIARSSTLGRTTEKMADRVYLDVVNRKRMDLFGKFCEEGYDPTSIARPLNRLFTEDAWKRKVTVGLLMFALCDRLGLGSDFEPNEEAQFRFIVIINGFYDGARESLKNIKIKN